MSILIYLATIFWSLFPNLIHVFQGGDDFINKINETNLVDNGDFSDGDNGWDYYNIKATIIDGRAYFYRPEGTGAVSLQQSNIFIDGNIYYYSFELENLITADTTYGFLHNTGNPTVIHNFRYLPLGKNNVSGIFTAITAGILYINSAEGSKYYIDNIKMYNVSQMIDKGIKNDNGILFSELTDEQIKTQLDTWIAEHGDLSFTITKDNTFDSWFNTGFVEKQAERDFLDYLGYFFWLTTPLILLFITLDIIRRLI